MKSLCNRQVSGGDPDTLKEIVHFVHEVHPVFCRHPLYFFAHPMRVKWWYHAKFQPFQSSFCSDFQFHGHLAQNKSVNASKISNYVRTGWKLTMWLWMVHNECKKVRSCNKLLKFWIAGVTDEFSSETLILRKRLSSLYTKCIQFLP